MENSAHSNNTKLSQLAATAICGNDITSSCLYVSALCIAYAGQYAFIALLIVGLVLFFFRKIYGEAVGALPLNGGAYNILLNTTSKGNASIAACLTILSYMATAVLSGSEAMKYLYSIFPIFSVIIATMILLTSFSFSYYWGHRGIISSSDYYFCNSSYLSCYSYLQRDLLFRC